MPCHILCSCPSLIPAFLPAHSSCPHILRPITEPLASTPPLLKLRPYDPRAPPLAPPLTAQPCPLPHGSVPTAPVALPLNQTLLAMTRSKAHRPPVALPGLLAHVDHPASITLAQVVQH